MGLIGSMLYPDNPKLAQELNDKEDKLRKQNNLHNDLVNSYRTIGEVTKTFDAYLMSLLAMQYHMAYAEQDLSDLPDTNLPQITQSAADKVESLALDVLTVKMAIDGFKAMKSGVANLTREGGIFNRTAPQGQDALSEGLGGEVESVSMETSVVRSGSVDLLTTESSETASSLSGELGEVASSLGEATSTLEETGEASSEVSEASELSEVASGTAEAGEAAAEAGAGTASAGFSAVLGPALLVVVAVTEVISAIHDGQTHAKLKEAEGKLDDLLSKSDDSLKSIKKVFRHLLKLAKTDINAYNKMLPDLYAATKEEALNRAPFSTGGIDAFLNGLDGITIDKNGTEGYQAAALANLEDSKQFISQHAQSSSQLTEIVKQIKTHMAKNNLKDVPDDSDYLKAVAEANSLSLEIVQTYNKFRRDVAELASVLKPYHEEVKAKTSSSDPIAKPPKKVTPGKADPSFTPKPGDFTIPTIKSS
ncbi:MAG TPA: hypothetical protein VKA18_05410 [Alphaproteobacteria bacterium]|nr:hypothetical protein [Alphaproteobacteria bacterium]